MKSAIEKFLGYLRSVRNSSPHTLRNYRLDLEQFFTYLSPPGSDAPEVRHIDHRIIREYVQTGRVPNVVNLAKKSAATHLLVVHHYDRVGVLSAVFSQLKHAGINVQETENIVFEGAAAAVARIHLDHAPPQKVLDAMRADSTDRSV